jgi:YihY family inner membrane protein
VLVSGALSFVAFFILFIYGPACHVSKRDTWFAALVTCVLFEVAKGGIAFYLARVGDFDPIFGALGGAAIFLVWVNLSARILIFGAEIASEYPKVKTGMFDPDPDAPKIPLMDRGRGIVRSFFVRDETPPT